MAVRSEVIKELEKHRGERVSGAQLARDLGVSRNAVWKAVNRLRDMGYDIDASTNIGYRLSKDSDILSVESIERDLRTARYHIHVFDEVDSTNSVLKQMAEEGAEEGRVVIANHQTAGRGRLGRNFCSPKGSGIYMSILLRPTISSKDSLLLTTCAAVCVSEAIEKLSGREASIKWVNDIFVNGKKCCGILTEASMDIESGGLNFAVLGIGINLYPPQGGFPPEIKSIATSVFETKEKARYKASAIIAEILNNFARYYPTLENRDFREEYRRRLFILNQQIDIKRGDEVEVAHALDIDEDFRLKVWTPNGIKLINSGEVSISAAP